MGFVTVPAGGDYRLRAARVPAALLAEPIAGVQPDADGLVLVDIDVAGTAIARVLPASPTRSPAAREVDLDGGQAWPCFLDLHTHLDKGHIWERAPNPDGTFASALRAVAADRARWSAADVRRRIEFGLRCSHAHGTRAVRTHLDSHAGQAAISWPVLRELRAAWAGRVELQGVSLAPLDFFAGVEGERLADTVAEAEGVLGAVTYMGPAIDKHLDRVLGLAAERRLDLDFHADESGDVGARSLAHVARAVLRHGYPGRVVCGHCCSLAVQPSDVVTETLDLVREAGIAVVTLPMCNMYLQDRAPGRSPRWRGTTLSHEMKARGIRVAVASDNCRDPFHGFGDHDMLEVFREATRIVHLDRPYGDWPRAVTAIPADLMGLAAAGRIGAGRPADLVLFRGRGFSELLARPQADRVVIRAGRALEAAPPDYRELDDLVRGGAA